MEIIANFNRKQGGFKPINGVNNGPVSYGSLVDVSHYFKEAAFPYVRLHDPNWPHPREVDIYSIFPDEDADPDDPSSYDFRRTDEYIKSVLDTGAQIVYRLGVSIEHTKTKFHIHPPKDYEKWARVCINIIRHYNHGWADGFRYGIRYWEIWNEPDGHPGVEAERSGMWTGTHEQYFDLYRVASLAIKQFDPELKVGGYAATMIHPEFLVKFFAYIKEHKLPLDFFSWHTYTNSIEKVKENAGLVRRLMEEHGYGQSESHFNEWNYAAPYIDAYRAEGERDRRTFFELQKSEVGASFAAAVLMTLQRERVDVANYYDAQPTALYCGLFDYYGVPQKTYYAFKAFTKLASCGTEAQIVMEDDDLEGRVLHAMAGIDDESGKAAVLISNSGDTPGSYVLGLQGLPSRNGMVRLTRYTLDRQHDLEETLVLELEGGSLTLRERCPEHAVILYMIND